MPENIENVVIGGGLAGAMAAITLARAGKQVVLLEKETSAHHKVCGEFISIEAQHYLQQADIDLIALGARPVTTTRLIKKNNIASSRLPFQALSLSRYVLDEALLQRAAACGVEIRRGQHVTGLVRDKDIWQLHIKDQNIIQAKRVFLGTGKHDLRGFKRTDKNDNLIGFKMHFKPDAIQAQALSNHVELYLFDHGYAGLELVENGLMNLCLVVTKQRFAACTKNWMTLLDDLKRETPLLAQRLQHAMPQWEKPLAIFGIPYGFVYRNTGNEPNLYRLGDQMAVIPSFCGDGMAIALHTGALAAQHCLKGDARSYHRAARKQLLPQIKTAGFFAALIQYNVTQKIFVTLAQAIPGLGAFIARRTRLKHY